MAEHTPFDSVVHRQILAHVIEHGRAPGIEELTKAAGGSAEEVQQSLERLHDNHALVLHANRRDVWIIHPFALFPTAFWVSSDRGRWWSNCVWCSLGVVAILGSDATITTNIAGENRQIDVHVRGGEVVERDLLVHFSVPVARAWDNVVYYCSTVLVFESTPDVDRWCGEHGIARGEVVPITQAWDLAKAWYGNHLAADWKKFSAAEASAVFASVGLTGPFWSVAPSAERF
jgi:hypothetical protein